MAKRYSIEEIEFIRSNYHQGAAYCASHLKRPYQSLILKANSMGLFHSDQERLALAIRGKEIPFDQYKIDPRQFFDIQKPEVAYFLGYFWADGHVSVNKNEAHPNGLYMFCMDIQKRDYLKIKTILSKMGKWIIYERQPRTSKLVMSKQVSVSIRTGNKHLVLFLLDQDYGKKSLVAPTKILSRIPDHLKHYWWRGYMDGDGSFTKMDSTGIAFTLASTYDQDWSEHERLMESLSIEYTVRRKIVKHGRASILYATNIDNVVKWGSYLYRGFDDDKIGLPRKHGRWLIALSKQVERDEHDDLKIEFDRPFDARAVFDLIKQYDGKLSRRKISEVFNRKPTQIDRTLNLLREQKKIRAKGHSNPSSRRFFII